ncbi:uncharacterized protein LOC116267451 isoform X1 [Nymphaea colorata]|uniref:uncharacterized protein LOC116267451 isoform X1 n=1 Tax=Nymphaea colorata TaxID=210225 RepID=UPI00129EBB25|nr:uncharacterized protein LOC116267451 isoform X1 [Nymphaea colorata]
MGQGVDQSCATKRENLPPSTFDPSRLISVMRRKALIKDLAAAYQAKCLTSCQQFLELQRKWEEPNSGNKTLEEMRRELMRQPKRLKKTY